MTTNPGEMSGTVPVEATPWYASKGFWLGFIQVVAAIIAIIKAEFIVENPEVAAAGLGIGGIATWIVRAATSRPVRIAREIVRVAIKSK